MKAKVLHFEKKIEELQHKKGNNTVAEETTHVSTEELTQAMSQVNLKDEEIKELKDNNKKLKLEKQNLQNDRKDLQEKVMRQKNKLKGKVHMQGAKHLLWDHISMDIAKVWEYVNFI